MARYSTSKRLCACLISATSVRHIGSLCRNRECRLLVPSGRKRRDKVVEGFLAGCWWATNSILRHRKSMCRSFCLSANGSVPPLVASSFSATSCSLSRKRKRNHLYSYSSQPSGLRIWVMCMWWCSTDPRRMLEATDTIVFVVKYTRSPWNCSSRVENIASKPRALGPSCRKGMWNKLFGRKISRTHPANI